MSADLLEISDNKITGYNGTAFAGQGGATGDYELSAGSGISIVDYPLEQKTVISVTAQGGNPEVEQAVIDNSATWNNVSAKLDTTALTAYQEITGMTAYQEAGSYLSANALDNLSGNWETVTTKLDTTAFSDVSGTFLTAHQDISNLMPKGESANFYPMTGNPSGFLTAHQDLSEYQTTAGMTAYMTTADSANFLTAVPAGTMNESAFGYDANDKISGYNGSAFAGWRPDETVLWSGDVHTTADSIHLSESPISFNKIRTVTIPDRDTEGQRPAQINDFDMGWNTQADANLFAQWQTYTIGANIYSAETWYLSGKNGFQDFKLIAGAKQVNSTVSTGVTSYQGTLKQVIGIGRKAQ